MKVNIVVVGVVVHAFSAMARLDATEVSWVFWLSVVKFLIAASVACMHVNVSVVIIVVEAFGRVVSGLQILAVEEPLLVAAGMASVHVHVVVVVVHIQAQIVVVGLQPLIVH